MTNNPKTKKGFTLIELLVVISIISLLSSVVYSTVGVARTKARDAQRIIELGQVQKALALYFEKYGTYPDNPPSGERSGACGSGNSSSDYSFQFCKIAQTLVTEGFLAKVPVAPPGFTAPDYTYHNYHFYNYGKGNTTGVLLVTSLEAAAPSTTGAPNTCRPWASGVNWCDQSSNTYYCICNPF